MTLAMQAKLLRVLEEKEFERVGGDADDQGRRPDHRRDEPRHREGDRATGRFREDLYYRLNVIPLHLPPLRERKDDIPLLAEHFIRKICKDLGMETKRLEPGVLDLFMRYNWPGNVRELEATLHRAIVMSNGETITRNEFYGLGGTGEHRRRRRSAAVAAVAPQSEPRAAGDHERRFPASCSAGRGRARPAPGASSPRRGLCRSCG